MLTDVLISAIERLTVNDMHDLLNTPDFSEQHHRDNGPTDSWSLTGTALSCSLIALPRSDTGFSSKDVIGQRCAMIDGNACSKKIEVGNQKKCTLFESGSMTKMRCQLRGATAGNPPAQKCRASEKWRGEVIGAVEVMTDVTSLYPQGSRDRAAQK